MTGRILLATLAICLVATLFWRNMPAPLPATASLERFSAGRAQTLVAAIARAPHPVQSTELARVRAYLLEHLRELGFAPEEQHGRVRGTRLTNLLVRIPGTHPTGTLLCLAHYDSVPSGPGAGDDSIGVACWMETLRALRTRGWQPKNDVLLLLTDGEERDLYGAELFIAEHPLMQSVACVINLEAIGNGGPAVLFQLGRENGACVRAFAQCVAAPTGTSLGDAVYRRMPNDTDFTPFLERGIAGFNLAITWGGAAYHAPHDTPANLDPRSLQHMGECALSLTQHIGDADLEALQSVDATFFDVLGYGLVRYSRGWDVVVALLGCALTWFVCARAHVPLGELSMQALRHVFEIAVVAATVGIVWWLFDVMASWVTPKAAWTPGNTTSAALIFVGSVGLTSGYELLRGNPRSGGSAVRICAIGLLWSVAALISLQQLRGASFVFAWPLILATIGMLTTSGMPPSRTHDVLLVHCFACALLLGLPILHFLLQLFERAPFRAIALTSATLASASGLLAVVFERIRRDVPVASRALMGIGLLALLASVVVSRVLDWRQGALLP